jgi:acid phosphatase family membrane protein YuiD
MQEEMHKEIVFFRQIIGNPVLFIGLFAWALAQVLKIPIAYILYHRINWGMMFSSGGMPSSHSALVTAITLAIGMFYGFDTPTFALAFAVSMIVLYDATGVRREAGRHAEKINILLNEFFSGHPISDKQLKEVIGHTPAQVLVGVVLGISTVLLFYLSWF